ncbi:MAG: hypothetical protein A2Z30_02245 [Chloroflexi bacterium RBG_16_64_43]|nr:MAG: hypothetical protein A2Z30_02245 [Chloroflexi bacterium RBG_16_64_43]
MGKRPCVYILASKCKGTLYVGVTSDLRKRVWTHQTGAVDGFTKPHSVHMVVYFELHATMATAIERERQLKKWYRRWKLEVVEEANPEWEDLASHVA